MPFVKEFIDPSAQDPLTQECLRLKKQLLTVPAYIRRFERAGDQYFVDLAMSSAGALISPEDVRKMIARKQAQISYSQKPIC